MASNMRTAGVAKNTVVKLLIDIAHASQQYQNRVLRNLPCITFEVDELWSFIYAKQKNVWRAKNAPRDAGDVWTSGWHCAPTPSWCRPRG